MIYYGVIEVYRVFLENKKQLATPVIYFPVLF